MPPDSPKIMCLTYILFAPLHCSLSPTLWLCTHLCATCMTYDQPLQYSWLCYAYVHSHKIFIFAGVFIVIKSSYLQVSSTENKLEDISNAVLQKLTASCAECGVTSDIIDRQSFACSPESPTSVIHCARLEGTSEIDSSSLISLIEEWVSDGPSIIVTGVRMAVDSECSVAISSLSEGECSPIITDPTMDTKGPSSTDQTSSDNTAAIIGGVVAVVLIITIGIIVIIVVVLKNRHGDLAIKNTEK